ncbi:hypothetical protein SAMN04488078_10261 [Antarctobacter heliothermus]|uniref:Uncharacterized protein n=1 Tax=Antarctobacter heliothermus TaxID=74033 RepID=A0A239GED1_9RHOB|nr:hypothetical protein SAMN04488078_10261 [Antarctobacter heliothermus]
MQRCSGVAYLAPGMEDQKTGRPCAAPFLFVLTRQNFNANLEVYEI